MKKQAKSKPAAPAGVQGSEFKVQGSKLKPSDPGILKTIPRAELRPSPTNPRKTFAAGPLAELAASIRAQGIQQPLLVRARPAAFSIREPDLTTPKWTLVDSRALPGEVGEKQFKDKESALVGGANIEGEWAFKTHYEIVAGERRWRASELAGLHELPVLVKTLTDAQVREIQLIENLQREDLSELEEGQSYRDLIDHQGYTVQKLQEQLGRSRSHIFARMALCKLTGKVLKAFQAGEIDASKAGLIATVPGVKEQERLLERASGENGDSVRYLKQTIDSRYRKNLSGAPWKISEPTPGSVEAGACMACPKRTGNIEGFEGSPNVCTDIACYKRRLDGVMRIKLDEAKAAGAPVMGAKEYDSVRYRCGKVNDECYEDSKSRKWGVLAKAAEITPTLAQTDDGIVEIITPQQKDAIKRKLKISSGSNGSHGPSAADRKKAALERKIDDATTMALVAAVEKVEPAIEFWRLLCLGVCKAAWSDTMRNVNRRRGWDHKEPEYQAYIEKMTLPQMRGLLCDILACQGLRGQWAVKEVTPVMLKLYKVDTAKIEAECKRSPEEVRRAKSEADLEKIGMLSSAGKLTLPRPRRNSNN